jgi:hypothetical protein
MNIFINIYFIIINILGYLEIFYNLYFKQHVNNIITYNDNNNAKKYIEVFNNNKIKKIISYENYNNDFIFNYDLIIVNEFIDNKLCSFFINQYNNNKITIENLFNNKTKPLFLSIQLNYCDNDYSIDITNNNFFFENNILFTLTQTKYLFKKYFNVDADENYTINIIDSDCKLINLKSSQFIFLTKNKYEIIDV